MPLSLLISGLLVAALFAGPLGVYVYALGRTERQLPAFMAGSAVLLALASLALAITRVPL